LKKKYLISFLTIILITVPLINVFGASYCLFDKENSQLLLMGKDDVQFTKKIDIGEKPDQILPTNDPNKYMAIYTPQAPKKGEEKNALKGELILFNSSTLKKEDSIELGYAPFTWVYTKDNKHLYISSRPSLESTSLELLHYDISQEKIEKLPNFTNHLDSICLSYDETKLFALIKGDNKAKTPGEILVLETSPLAISNKIVTTLNPQGLFFLNSQKIVLVDADEKNKKQQGVLQVINQSDYSTIEKYSFPVPYKISNNWYADDQTLITIADTPGKQSIIYKITPEKTQTFTTKTDWLSVKYIKDKDQLFILAKDTFRVVDFNSKKETVCVTGDNRYEDPFSSSYNNYYNYEMKYIPVLNSVMIYCKEGGKVKLVDLGQNQMSHSATYGRRGAKFGHFMANIFVNALFNAPFYMYTPIQSSNIYNEGTSVISDTQRTMYFILSLYTKDVTVFDKNFQNPKYIVVPDEKPIALFQVNKLNPQNWLVTDKRIYLINPDDLSLKPIFDFKVKINSCVFFEEEKRLIALTDQEIVVIDPSNLEIENSRLLYGEPSEKFTHLQNGEKRYHFIPIL
jgi:hypothetical protein